jgi:DNA polymerase-3 subunit gamma/tau
VSRAATSARSAGRSAADGARAEQPVGSAVGGGQTAQAVDPAAGEAPQAQPIDPQAAPDARWAAFLDVLRVEGGLSLFMAASNCEMMRLDDERLDLHPMNGGIRMQLTEPEAMKRLRKLVHAYLGEGVRVELVDASGGGASDSPAPKAAKGVSSHTIEADRQAKMQQQAMEHPIVQTVLEVFDGKLEKVSQADE